MAKGARWHWGITRGRSPRWLVMCCDLKEEKDRRIARADSEEEARAMARRLNLHGAPPGAGPEWFRGKPLYYVEFWCTASSLRDAVQHELV